MEDSVGPCPCESGKEKLDMAEAMLDGDLLESWKLWRKTESSKEKEGRFNKEMQERYTRRNTLKGILVVI